MMPDAHSAGVTPAPVISRFPLTDGPPGGRCRQYSGSVSRVTPTAQNACVSVTVTQLTGRRSMA